ncbi:peptidase YpeB-like protein [Pseudomonas duriflava]|uniref:Peptidase YpeB-like protein n=2 Tax=Pseudomonas duriflava TaxID=459528 RepID=A0A562QAB5_9PSED|nr:peptidase YpeB-like protein [Pseudomonas duriflava]
MARDLDQDEALSLRSQGLIQPLEVLISHAYARYPGATLLEAELEEESSVYVYELELLVGGVVREIEISAQNGTILKDEVDD